MGDPDVPIIDFCCMRENLLGALGADGSVFLGEIAKNGETVNWRFYYSLKTHQPDWNKRDHKQLSSLTSDEICILSQRGPILFLNCRTHHVRKLDAPRKTKFFIAELGNRCAYINWSGELIISTPQHEEEVISSNWNRFTRLFISNGILLAEGCTGECTTFVVEQLICQAMRNIEANQGKAILIGGFRSFQSLSPYQECTMFGLNRSGELYRYKLQSSSDSSGNPALTCKPMLLKRSIRTDGLSGYSWPVSARAGDKLRLYISGAGRVSIELKDLITDGPLLSGQKNKFVIDAEPQNTTDPTSGECDWPVSLEIEIPLQSKSTLATARLSQEGQEDFDIVFVITDGIYSDQQSIGFLISTNTWCAYNSWAGVSKYGPAQPTTLSFRRPNPAVTPVWDGYPSHLLVSDLWAIKTIKKMGFTPFFTSDFEFEAIDIAQIPSPLILLTHPEYWTISGKTKLEEFIAQGGYLVYLGGNGVFEACNLNEKGATLEVFVGGGHPERAKSYFRNLTPLSPERTMLGVAFKYDIDWKADPSTHLAGPYIVEEPDHWAFEGMEVRKGTRIGLTGRNGGGACGWEMDTSKSGDSDLEIVAARGESDRGIAPSNCIVLARGYQELENTSYGGDMVIIENSNGAGGVFSVGSICFCGSLVEDKTLQMLLTNVLKRFSQLNVNIEP